MCFQSLKRLDLNKLFYKPIMSRKRETNIGESVAPDYCESQRNRYGKIVFVVGREARNN